MITETADPALLLMELAADCSKDPAAFARGFWPHTQPRKWQAEVLAYITEYLNNPATRFQPCKIAVSSGHGIGKSAFMGMITAWAQATKSGAKALITAGTGQQLSTKTVPEISKWVKSSLAADWFDVRATSIRSTQTAKPENWRADFVTWSVHNTEAFAGLHNENRRLLLVFDEASAIDDKVWEVAEGALTDENTEIIWLAFGNPTQNSGRFRECFGRFKHRWKTFQIDSRTVEGTNKEQIDKWIEDYGEDSDFVRVRVRGEFPRAGSSQFIAADIVADARKFKAVGYEGLPKILGVDVARFGDDQTVMFLRQGRKAQLLGAWRGKDVAEVTAQVIAYIEEHKPDGVVVDSDGIGAPVYDNLKFRGYGKRLFDFHGGHPATDANAYFNQRAEVWGKMRDWLKAGAEIPDIPDLDTDLTGPEYGFSPRNQLQLERKDDMKARGLSSPDYGDALAMTFAVQVAAPAKKDNRPKYVEYESRETSWMA